MAEIYIYSTLTGSQNYATENGKVLVKGGANLPGAKMPDGEFITSLGAVTKLTAEQYQGLEQNQLFKLHKANGFLKVDQKKVDIEVVVADMASRDGSAPDTDSDSEAKGRKVRKLKD